ncbi:MAG: thiamine pyrophosphate-dependent enzyme [Pseudomonadota bacterium]
MPSSSSSGSDRAEPTLLTVAEELDAYRAMLMIRRFEEKAGQLYGMGYIGGYCHLCIGQEAVVTGLAMAARDGDQVISTYRHHGHMLAAGIDPNAIMAELTGRASGLCKGKGGSMHMFSKAHRYYGGHGIVGAPVPLGAGLALANRYRGSDAVVWCTLGERAADQGQVYETLVMAAAWKLPLVLVIENNATIAGDARASDDGPTSLARRGQPFAIPGEQVDGIDVAAVESAGRRVGAWVRQGNGPYILEILTCRYRGHVTSDRARQQTASRARREHHDPIELSRTRILQRAAASEEQLKAIDREVRAIVNRAAQLAQSDAEPDPASLTANVVL